MAFLEDPDFDVTDLGGGDLRVAIETQTMVLKMDLSVDAAFGLATELVEAVIAHEAVLEECTLCGPESGLDEEDPTHCALSALRDMLSRALREKKHR